LVTGGYQRLGDLIRITARFVEVESGTVIRTVKIDGAIGDIFDLQDKIV
jgi:adenylate cyclase